MCIFFARNLVSGNDSIIAHTRIVLYDCAIMIKAVCIYDLFSALHISSIYYYYRVISIQPLRTCRKHRRIPANVHDMSACSVPFFLLEHHLLPFSFQSVPVLQRVCPQLRVHTSISCVPALTFGPLFKPIILTHPQLAHVPQSQGFGCSV